MFARPWHWPEIQTCPQDCAQGLVSLCLLDRELILTSITCAALTGLAGHNLHWIGIKCYGRHLNRFLYVLVSLSQADRVCKARVHFPVHTADLAELR